MNEIFGHNMFNSNVLYIQEFGIFLGEGDTVIDFDFETQSKQLARHIPMRTYPTLSIFAGCMDA